MHLRVPPACCTQSSPPTVCPSFLVHSDRLGLRETRDFAYGGNHTLEARFLSECSHFVRFSLTVRQQALVHKRSTSPSPHPTTCALAISAIAPSPSQRPWPQASRHSSHPTSPPPATCRIRYLSLADDERVDSRGIEFLAHYLCELALQVSFGPVQSAARRRERPPCRHQRAPRIPSARVPHSTAVRLAGLFVSPLHAIGRRRRRRLLGARLPLHPASLVSASRHVHSVLW